MTPLPQELRMFIKEESERRYWDKLPLTDLGAEFSKARIDGFIAGAETLWEKMQEDDGLWEEVEKIFDSHTAATGGGYEADYTDKSGFFSDAISKFIIIKRNP